MTFLFHRLAKPLRLHLLLPAAGEVMDQFTSAESKEQNELKAAMPKQNKTQKTHTHKVLLEKSLHGTYEGLNVAHMITGSLKNTHLLGNERHRRRKWYKGLMLEMTGTLEFDLRFKSQQQRSLILWFYDFKPVSS